jgi:hypothetical protein
VAYRDFIQLQANTGVPSLNRVISFKVLIQGVSGGILHILGGCSIDYSE